MNKLALKLVRLWWPVDPQGIQRTHHETCYTSHCGCAVNLLADEVEMLRHAIGEFVKWDKGSHGGRWAKALHRLHEIADEAKEQA